MPSIFNTIDLFAGPGGLGEGFTSFEVGAHAPFRLGISVEKEASAHKTLVLRAFLREYRDTHGVLPDAFIEFHAGKTPAPDWQAVDARAWQRATKQARCLELGTSAATEALDETISTLRKAGDDTILIGGPPCQAYSLVGRARSRSKPDYVPEQDARHYLFREYIRVLDRLRPAAFVMENVKGLLSSTVDSRLVFEMLMESLSSLGTAQGHLYELRAIRAHAGRATLQEAHQPKDFIVQAEDFGVPQRRHRVIIVGIRSDLAAGASRASIATPTKTRTVDDAIGSLAALRSGLSRGNDDPESWLSTVVQAAKFLGCVPELKSDHAFQGELDALTISLKARAPMQRSSSALPSNYGKKRDRLSQWLEQPELHALAQHETRGHMAEDLERYLFAAVYGRAHNRSPKAPDFPQALRPKHHNWLSGAFSDRFRVQLAHDASTTVTSHISKDGHYFIHPDPIQCRSLTVREAARLQTFPDDYLFLGNRTEQYVQVGNAVPPFLARQIAALVHASVTDQPTHLNADPSSAVRPGRQQAVSAT